MHDEHDLHYRQWRAEYERRLDEDYRAWMAQRAGGAPPGEPGDAPEGGLSSLGRAVSDVVLGSEAHPGGVTGVRGVYEDQTDERPGDVSRSREGR